MREFSISEFMLKKMKKTKNKNRPLYDALRRTMEKVLNTEDVTHFKNLRKPLQDKKRAHIKGPFVLTFKYLESRDFIVFYDFDHHDAIYVNE